MNMRLSNIAADPLTTSRAVRPHRGFTLVELLVVVSIIALLISILLPSLKKARAQAKQVKCAAHLNGISKGNTIYGTEFNGWFVGSPATTGQQLYAGGGAFADNAFDTPGAVAQIWDWAGPIVAQTMESHWHRAERWRTTLVTGSFSCASNQFTVTPYPDTGAGGDTADYEGWGSMPMVSYTTMRAMMTRGGSAPTGASAKVELQYFHPQIGGTEAPPDSYEPRLERVGNPSEKIFLTDGARYIETQEGPRYGLVTYNLQWAASAGGSFSANAPTAPDEWDRSFIRSKSSDGKLAKYAYRHPNGSVFGLMAVYFDGHAEWMSEDQTRWPDPWWPKGTALPRAELNPESQILTRPYWETGGIYYVRR